MTGQERVERGFVRKEQDRLPRYESFWLETIARWQQEGLQGDACAVHDIMDADFAGIGWVWPNPYEEETVLEEAEETKIIRRPSGAILRIWKNKSGTPEHLDWECKDPAIWRDKFRARYEDRQWELPLDDIRQSYVEARRKGRWAFAAGVEPFEMLRDLVGDENFLMAMIEEPEWIAEMAEVLTGAVLAHYRVMLDAGIQPDGIWTYGDMAFKNGPFCSPEMYRELIWPQHKRMADFAHANGMRFIYHTDGDVNSVVPDYIAAGFDALQPLEAKTNMDVRSLCPQYGDRLAFFGNIDVMKFAFASMEEIEAEIVEKFAAGKATHGYFYHSDHSVPPQVSWERYQYIIEFVRRHGQY